MYYHLSLSLSLTHPNSTRENQGFRDVGGDIKNFTDDHHNHHHNHERVLEAEKEIVVETSKHQHERLNNNIINEICSD